MNETQVATTNRELFDGMQTGTKLIAKHSVVRMDDQYGKYLLDAGKTYVWTGRYRAERGVRTDALVIEETNRNVRHVNLDTVPVFNVTGFVTSDREQFLVTCLMQDRDSDEQQNKVIDALYQKISDYENDFAALNHMLNEHAEEAGYEEEWEEVIASINKVLKASEFHGRMFMWEVLATVTMQYEVRLEVEAPNRDAADDKLHELNDDEVVKQAKREDDCTSVKIDWQRDPYRVN